MYGDGLTQITGPLLNLWNNTTTIVPSIIAALIIFVVGLIIASALGTIVQKILEAVKLDQLLKSLNVEHYFERAGMKLRASWFLGQLVFWFLAVAFLLAASDILQLAAFSFFLQRVLNYIPNIVVGVLIMLAAVVLANFARVAVKASVKSARLPAAHFLGTLVWWAIVVFGFLATLIQLNIGRDVINTIITGFIAMLALAGGLAFGLGGRDYATHLIGKLREHTESR